MLMRLNVSAGVGTGVENLFAGVYAGSKSDDDCGCS